MYSAVTKGGASTSSPGWSSAEQEATGDPTGLLSRPRGIVGLVGPYRVSQKPPGMFFLREEELVEETSKTPSPDGVGEVSPTPGRENWKLQENTATLCGGGDLRKTDDNGIMSMTDVWPKDWGLYHEQPERDSLNEGSPAAAPSPESPTQRKLRGSRSLLGILHSGRSSVASMLEQSEPFCHLWVLLSSLYGKLVVVLMLAFCLTEVMDNNIKLLSLQGIFLMYLYVGSIAVIICIYIWVLIDSCASLGDGPDHNAATSPQTAAVPTDHDAELGGMAHLTRFGSLKRAHISRAKTSGTSFYLRVGALAFGLGTLVFNGLEMAMHSMMEGACLNDVVFVHPVLHGLFTFLQMHFLFVNSQVLVERFGLAARFGFMHLAATNLALWVRLIIWESGNEWTYFVHLAQGTHSRGLIANDIPTPLQLRGFPRSMAVPRHQRDLTFSTNVTSPFRYRPISDGHISQVVSLHECLNTNSLGQLWTSSMPFLYPFIVQFSLIAAAVTFIMGKNVGRQRILLKQKKLLNNNNSCSVSKGTSLTPLANGWAVDCSGASKGLFLGLLCLVAGIVVIIIFLVVKEDESFPADTVFWLTTGALSAILSLCCIMTTLGLVQIRRLSLTGHEPSSLDALLATVAATGVQLYSIFGMVVGAGGLGLENAVDSSFQSRHAMLIAVSLLQLIQATSQSALIAEALRRASLTRHQMLLKPGRQVITFLLCSNAVLWAFDTFVTQSWMSQELQLRFFGVLAWGVISRIGLPLLVFYRFHSCVLLLEVWKRSYRTPLMDPGN
ncbi:proton channel OtopLc [Anabrus simplex]|uniref:proton channel OtopLc n=1 Tax=Anabrus simplex TaxID=316456 RepID=UPI0034DCF83E